MKIRVLLGTCLLSIASGAAHALGLGEILVNSRLNQPLDAEILVRESVPGEAEQLVAKLASQEDFARVGLERARMPTLLRFETAKNARGQTVIRVRSDEPIREPFLTLLVEANWSGGRLLREYGVLLDPPVAAPASTIARTQPPAAAPAQPAQTAPLPSTPPPAPVATTPAPAPARPVQPAPTPAPPPASATAPPPAAPPASTRPPPGFAPPGRPAASATPTPQAAAPPPPAAEPPPAPAPVPAPTDEDGRYTVQRGDTLSGIASQYAADSGVTVNQMMLALQRNNPNAFFADNINALKAGAVLRVPDAADARTITVVDASAQVRGQIESWTGATLADAGAAPVRTTRPAAAPDSDRLELLPPSADAPGSDAAGRAGSGQGGAAVAEVQAELQRTREDLTSRNQELSELNSRVRDLEELNAKNARLLELKDGEIAELQRRLAEASAAAQTPAPSAAAAPAEPTAAVADTPAATGQTQAEPPAATDPAADPIAAAEPATPEGADTPPLAEGIPETGQADPAVAATPPAEGEDDWEAGATPQSDPFAETTEPEAAADTPTPAPIEPATPAAEPPPAAQPAVTTTAPASTPAEQPWYMQPLYQGAVVLALALLALIALLARRRRPAPVAEPESSKRSVADLFGASPMAVTATADASAGSDVNEEALALQAQIARHPDDHGAYLELLSLYYAEGDSERFAEWAERMSGRPGSRASVEWDQVRSMGEEMLPDHPLFAAASPIVAAPPPPAARPAWLDEVETRREPLPSEPPAPPPPAAPEPEAPAKRVYDLSDTEFKLDEPFESAIEDDAQPIEYQLDELESVEVTPVTPAPRAAERDEDDAGLPALVFDDEDLAPATPAFAGTRSAAGDADEPDGMDDAATKLELARAYLDMGDPEGARAMLEEVLGEGDTSQREEARKLLAVL